MEYIGLGKNNVKLQIGDICTFIINKQRYEGIIMYDEDVFAFVFEMEDDNFPAVIMLRVDIGSIEKIRHASKTEDGDKFEFFRDLYIKRLIS